MNDKINPFFLLNILSSPSSTAKRLGYLKVIDEMLEKIKDQTPDVKLSDDDKLEVRKAYSHGGDLL